MTFTFAGTIGSWITSDWELVERILDFHPIEDKEHEGEYAAIGLAKRLADLEVLEKIGLPFIYATMSGLSSLIYLIAATLDNAAPNDVLIRALSRLLREKFDVQFVPENSQIRCLAHVVNLVVQKMLAALEEAPDPAVEDQYIPNKDLPFHYDLETDDDVRDLEQEVFPLADGVENEENDATDMMNALAPEFTKMSPLQKASDVLKVFYAMLTSRSSYAPRSPKYVLRLNVASVSELLQNNSTNRSSLPQVEWLQRLWSSEMSDTAGITHTQ